MKKVLVVLTLLVVAETLSAQEPSATPQVPGGPSVGARQERPAQRKFQILVENERNAKSIQENNNRLMALQDSTRGVAERGVFGDLLWTGYASAFKQKTVNATSNLVSLGLNYFSEAVKSKREKWYKKAQQQCHYSQLLSAETKIDDFYALPSTKGALDPANLKFEGFGLKNYIEVADGSKEGVGVFYIFCKMRRDTIGLRHIINHSKFLVEVDSLVIDPKYCNLPNDSSGSAAGRFSFEKRDQLKLELKVRFYSSWMNQATMIASNQQLGEFTISVDVDKNKLNADGKFVYDKSDSSFDRLVSIDGDCFIVPRSYTGTTDAVNYQPTWGTGEYRIEMEVSESCCIVDEYYQIRESGNGKDVAFADGTPGKKKWDKAKWKTEWRAMNVRRKSDSILDNTWKCIVSAYKGSGWMATLTDPLTTALYTYETQKLDEWLNELHEVKSTGTASGATSGVRAATPSQTPSASAPSDNGEKPQGDKLMGGGKPQ